MAGKGERKIGPGDPSELKIFPLLKVLSDSDLVRVFDAMTPMTCRARHPITAKPLFRDNLAFIWSGEFRIIEFINSNLATKRDLSSGDVFALATVLARLPVSDRVRVLPDTNGVLLVVPGKLFVSLYEQNSDLARAVAFEMARLAYDFSERLKRFSSLATVPQRLRAELLQLADEGKKVAGGVLIQKKLTHAYLAQSLGVSRETISRELSAMKRSGEVKVEGQFLIVTDKVKDTLET